MSNLAPIYLGSNFIDSKCPHFCSSRDKLPFCSHPEQINAYVFGNSWEDPSTGKSFSTQGSLILTCKDCEYRHHSSALVSKAKKLLELKIKINKSLNS